MTRKYRVMVVLGTRPEAIKLAPLVLALRESDLFEPLVVATAQHRDMLDEALTVFGITPDVDLDLFEHGQSLPQIAARALEALAGVIERYGPHAVVVQGDTTTTLAGSLTAFYQRVPVVHLEAGLRTGDRSSPFPEEVNRRLTTSVTTLHLAPTATARAALVKEGVVEADIVVTGNTVIDALLWTISRAESYGVPELDDLDRNGRRVLLVTAHRRESWGPPLHGVGRALAAIARQEPELLTVLPVHKNPIVRESLAPAVAGLPNVLLLEPLRYDGFARLMARSHLVLTDSGGIQEEAPSLGKPVLVMRDTTERPEAVAAGTARLVGTNPEGIVRSVRLVLNDDAEYAAMAKAVNPYGDGAAASRAVAALAHFFGEGERPEDYTPGGGG
jgi:UDP-N-acetylglucosamine 2-epimerase (non-hydrolysing)